MPKSEDSKDDLDKTEDTVKHDDGYVFNVTTSDDSSKVKCDIGGIAVTAIIDSGSKYNLLSESIWKWLKSKSVVVSNQRKETGKVFRAYGGHELPQLGAFTAEIAIYDRQEVADFYVICSDWKILIGRDTAVKMGILRIGTTVNEIGSVDKREEIGMMKGIVIDIPIKADAKPVIQPYRRIPAALEKSVDAKIEELLAQGIVERVNRPSKWVSSVVAVPKGDDMRICIDMRRANQAVERENHPQPTIEDFLPHLGKAKVFSRLDVKNQIDRRSHEIFPRQMIRSNLGQV